MEAGTPGWVKDANTFLDEKDHKIYFLKDGNDGNSFPFDGYDVN